MRKHYYIVEGLQPWTKEDEKKLDKLAPNGFIGNVTEKLMQKGYVMDKETLTLMTADGEKVCRFCKVL